MKRTLSLWLGLVAIAAMPVLAQAPAAGPMGKLHGHVINPTGAPQTSGSVTVVLITRAASGPGLSAETKNQAVLPVDSNGEFSADVPVGSYNLVFRQPDTPPDKQVDHIDNVHVNAGQTTEQDIDMSRQAFIDLLPADQKQKLEELRKHNSEALKVNEVIKRLNSDLKIVAQDIKDADGATTSATAELGASATKQAIDAKATEIKTAKYTEVEDMMTKDSAAKPDASILFARLGQAQLGLKKFDAAEASFKKALEIESTSKKPSGEVQALSDSGLGEAYAREGKVPEATAAFDDAAKANPPQAAFYLKNETVIFFQQGNAAAQEAAADKAIAADPNNALLYYLKGQALVGNATIDPKTQKIVLPPGCAEAYQKYLDLAPTGPYAADAKGILDQAGQKINSSYKAGKKS
jgi:tetratricopeptide (TPR) repeat protein